MALIMVKRLHMRHYREYFPKCQYWDSLTRGSGHGSARMRCAATEHARRAQGLDSLRVYRSSALRAAWWRHLGVELTLAGEEGPEEEPR